MTDDNALQLPAFSIIVTCYNLEKYIVEGLESAFSQDYTGKLQWVIIDDCSQDSSVELIKDVLDQKAEGKDYIFIQNAKNLGIAGAMDEGILHAKYDWLIWVDGDDVQLPCRCQLTAKAIMDNPGGGFLMFARHCIDSQGNCFRRNCSYGSTSFAEAPHYLYLSQSSQRCSNFVELGYRPNISSYGCAVAMNKSLFRQWGNLNGAGFQGRCAQDPTWELRAALSGPILGVNEVVCLYRMHESNLYNRSRRKGRQGYVDFELFWQKNQRVEMAIIERMELDLRRVKQQPELCDWSKQELLAAQSYLSSRRAACEIRINWWNLNVFSRFCLAWRFRKKLPAHMRTWPWPRLLPLSLFASLRYWKKEKRKK